MRAFVNTLDIEAGTDQLQDLASWRTWADKHNIDGHASREELQFARRLRESLRDGMLANHDRLPLPGATVDALNEAADRANAGVRFAPDGARVLTSGTGMNAVLGRLVSVLSAAMNDGTWTRLKACAADDCRWAFYDSSRSRTGQWCSMSICGNRAKQARWRQQSGGSAG
ncbi:hypothetical protein GCM10011313_26000 [Mycetocola zhadangensis]|nr:hypothetical protein GCM10011313_26000 [Mycetocola zhadangensis]